MKIKEGFVLRPFADHWVAIPLEPTQGTSHMVVSLNSQGAFFWEQMQEESSFEEVLRRILDVYEVEESRAKQDLERFVQMLDQAGLLA